MSLSNKHIDLKRISDYFSGKLTPEEMHSMEMEAQNDPFLYEAMEGYEAHPEGLEQFKKLHKSHAKSSRSFFGSGTLMILGIACVVYLIAWIIKPTIEDPDYPTEMTEIELTEEIYHVPESIDTFEIAAPADQIRPNEIVVNKPLIELTNDPTIRNPQTELPDHIDIEELPLPENDEQLIPEDNSLGKVIYAPYKYYYDLAVVDYTRIKRERTDITYIRYEFTGLSAEFEDELSRDNREQIEKEVNVPYMEYLERTIELFANEEYKKALNRFLTILEQYPKDLNGHFYGALCYYNMKQYEKSLQLFDDLLKFENEMGFIAFRQEAKWYKAKALLKLGKKSAAKEILDEIIMEGLFYTQDAIQLKKDL